jgi:Arc/MetJ-type ribon-helix-helix transcriptional regulator
MSKETTGKTVCFDYSHNNNLTIESPSYADFTQYLFGSSFRLGKVQAGFSSLDKLRKYRMLVIGGPREAMFELEEINVLVEFVKIGGSLLVINDEGGDYEAGTNLSELTTHFGFEYNPDIISDSMDFQNTQTRVIVKKFEPHPVSRNVDSIVQSSACSIKINKLIEADENIQIIPLAQTGFNSFRSVWDGETWQEDEDAPKSVLSCLVNYHKGRVVALSTISMFSSLSSSYGYFAHNNQDFIASIFNWLLEPISDGTKKSSDEKLINVNVNFNLFSWMEDLVREKKWGNVADIINFSVKYLKDNYSSIIDSIEERKKQLKVERQKQLEQIKQLKSKSEQDRQKALYDAENDIIGLVGNVDTAKELKDIMASLSSITGGEVGKDFNINELEQEVEVEKTPESTEETLVPESTEEKPIVSESTEEESIASESTEDESIASESTEEKSIASESTEEKSIASESTEEKSIASESTEEKSIASESTEDLPTPESVSELPTPESTAEEDEPEKSEPKDIPLPDAESLSLSIQDEINLKLSAKIESTQKSAKKEKQEPEKPKEKDEIEDALNILGSFDDFTKKLEQFKTLSDDDGPMTEASDKKSKKISDDELFE